MIVAKEKIMFRKKNNFLNSKVGRDKQKENEGYQALKKDIAKQGMINPLLCIEEDGMYKVCIGMRRFIAGEELGMTEFNVKVLPNDEIPLLQEEIKKQIPTEVK
jgi:ParB-like chromosome segregation protein Spo0J|tara:strand:- start:409 stop:720 length:312 start_codon:yes stop_codon:yes gene_type:complete